MAIEVEKKTREARESVIRVFVKNVRGARREQAALILGIYTRVVEHFISDRSIFSLNVEEMKDVSYSTLD